MAPDTNSGFGLGQTAPSTKYAEINPDGTLGKVVDSQPERGMVVIEKGDIVRQGAYAQLNPSKAEAPAAVGSDLGAVHKK